MSTLGNRVKVTTATTGTGTITLGAAYPMHQTFADAGVANGDSVSYLIVEGLNWELGVGTYTSAGTTLTRSVVESSNSGAAISLAGAADVAIVPLAGELQRAAEMDQYVATIDAVSFVSVNGRDVAADGAKLDSYSANLGTFTLPANTTISSFGASLIDDASAVNARATLGLTIGTHVQAYSANLDTYAANALTAGEITQLQNINSKTISNTQWGYLGALDQNVNKTASPQFNVIQVGNATDTTLARAAAGQIKVEGSRVYLRNNVIGNVSQNAGVPTGAIFEEGSNANGQYVKYADGTMICTKKLHTMTYSASNRCVDAWTFPASFVSTTQQTVTGTIRGPLDTTGPNSVATDATIGGTEVSTLALGNFTVSSVQVGVIRINGGTNFVSGDKMYASMQAIGRWF